MNKSILIIDTPKKCGLCLLCGRGIEERFCIAKLWIQGNTKDCDVTELDKVLEGCPLKPFPEKRENEEGFDDIDAEWYADSYCEGWNDCIDEILGGEDGYTSGDID